MQLKKIILKGFKSFPEKTVLEFNEGVTAIVGPNGSGKSNIIEAIRWVMGEQSAKNLRGERMNDVIFSGTKELHPLNIAEVELILDNSDYYLDIEYEEVSIIRRLSRNEGSTYMINQQECLLRDIVDLFMDSGLGKESFSIISQGQVEAVFNSKPEDRRSIFEEAAGVYKYKVRKEDAETKLEETQDNLNRIQDILYELESQVKPLEKQSKIAQDYLEKREKLTELDIGVTVWQIKNIAEKVKFDKQQHELISKKISETENEIEKLEKERSRQQQEITRIEIIQNELNEKLLETVQQKERVESSLKLLDEKEHHREFFIAEKNKSIQAHEQQIIRYQKELDANIMEQEKLNKTLSELQLQVEESNKKIKLLETDNHIQMDDLRNEYIELLQLQTSLKNEVNYLKQELKKSEYQKSKKSDDISKIIKNQKQIEKDSISNEEKHNNLRQSLEELLIAYKENEKSLQLNKKELNNYQNKILNISATINRAQAKQSSLKDMQENYSGYYAGVRSVMNQKDNLTGIVGTVAELIDIPEEYMNAIDTALGSTSQFIIVQDEKAGRNAINYLKNNKLGRATFLPQTIIKPRTINPNAKNKILNAPGFIGIASEIVKNDSNIQNIVDNLLGQTIIAKTLKEANQLARLINFQTRVVSLDGDIINAGGSMTGGGRKGNHTPVFSQKAELKKLSKIINSNKNDLVTLEEQIIKYENEETRLVQLEKQIREDGEEQRLLEQQFKNKTNNLQEELARINRELKVTEFEKDELDKDIGIQARQLDEKEKELTSTGLKVKSLDEQMHLLNTEQEDISEAQNKLSLEISKFNEKINETREQLASIRPNIENYKNQINENKISIEQLKLDIKQFDKNTENRSKEELKTIAHDKVKEQLLIEDKQSEIRENLKTIQTDFENVNDTINQLNKEYKNLTAQKSKLDIQISKNDVRMDHNLEYLVDEYKISYEEARFIQMPDETLKESEARVNSLKQSIEDLGPVNLNSIDEFKEINDRYQFLNIQQNDLIDAKENLIDTMQKMDAIVEKQFEETFEEIRIQFSKVFPKMFGGGHAELVLEDPSNLLNTGIEIIAQPPGKKLSNLSLLSGGERALTAISLLFSIIQVNPIPFCILDEAEAALDDSNVARFGKFLQEFEGDTQFIVITHRKGTMEYSDQLYGVTMQEKGVSKIVSVSLQEAREIDGVT